MLTEIINFMHHWPSKKSKQFHASLVHGDQLHTVDLFLLENQPVSGINYSPVYLY